MSLLVRLYAGLGCAALVASPSAAAAQGAPPAPPSTPAVAAPAPLPLRSFGRNSGGGLTRYGVSECAQDLRLGFFLADAPPAFAAVPDAHLHARRAGAARRLGFGFWTASLSLLVGDIVYALAAGDRLHYGGASGAIFFSLLGGSAVASVVAQDRLRQADGELAEATRLWNQEAFARASGRRPCP